MKKIIAFCIAISLLIALASVSAFAVDISDLHHYYLYVYFVNESGGTRVPSSNITVNGNTISISYSDHLFNAVRFFLYGSFSNVRYIEDNSYFSNTGGDITNVTLSYRVYSSESSYFADTTVNSRFLNFRQNFDTPQSISHFWYDYTFRRSGQTTTSISFTLSLNVADISNDNLTIVNKLDNIDGGVAEIQDKLDNMMNYESSGGSSDIDGASELVESISGDVNNINNTIQQHSPHVQNWFETSPVAGDLVNIALLANSWLPAYLNCDPDVSFYWGLVTFCILLTLIENGLRRRPWHGFDDGGDFESEYDVTSTDEKGRSRTIHNKVSGSRRRVR